MSVLFAVWAWYAWLGLTALLVVGTAEGLILVEDAWDRFRGRGAGPC